MDSQGFTVIVQQRDSDGKNKSCVGLVAPLVVPVRIVLLSDATAAA